MGKETIEQKTYRLLTWVYGAQPSFKSVRITNDFKLRCVMVEMALAEEREACAKTCENIDAYEAYEPEVRQECADAIRARSEP